jgi:hypothetical protein
MTTTCRDCNDPVRFERTERGKKIILNDRPDPLGNVVLIPSALGPVARVLSGSDLTGWRGPRWMPHWATCQHNGSDSRGRWRGRI